MINSKEHIIKYFNSGIKETKDFRIGELSMKNFYLIILIIKELITQK